MRMRAPNRDRHRAISNNPADTNKNQCGLAVTKSLGVDGNVRFIHTWSDILRAIRTAHLARSRRSRLPKRCSVGQARKRLARLAADERPSHFVVGVECHVLLLGGDGRTIVDTDPRKRDRRQVQELVAVWASR
jgi:hypothetical protein